MLEQQSIFAWIKSLPDLAASEPSEQRQIQKRKRDLPYNRTAESQVGQLSSPPPSDFKSDMDATPTRKRQRIATHSLNLDPDLTPRPSSQHGYGYGDSGSSAGPSSCSSRSRSPKKQLMNLSLADDGLEVREIDIDAAPAGMESLLSVMQQVQNGQGILPADRCVEIEAATGLSVKDDRLWRYSFKPAEEPDKLPGRIPTMQEVSHIRQMAKLCQSSGHDEAGWNMEVHHRILSCVFRDPLSSHLDGCSLNFAPCTTARASPDFIPRHASTKMVDFCIYDEVNTEDEQQLRARRALSRSMPTLTVNHTDFRPTQLCPILLSIETKKPGKELDNANLQIGVWHAAQWASLRRGAFLSICRSRSKSRRKKEATGKNVQSAAAGGGSNSDSFSSQEQIEMAKLVDERLDQLPFIPGLIVQGHKWSIVFSTRNGSKTILWTEWDFGNTQSLQNTFKVIAGLREVSAWMNNNYLPWWQKNILDGFIESEPT